MMDVKQLIQTVFTKPQQSQPVGNPLAPFVQPPKLTKNDVFNQNILAEAQKTFSGGQPATQDPGAGNTPQPKNPPSKGTVGNLIPPGWSSQAKG